MKFHKGYDVFHWPEFKAFADRLGIADIPATRAVAITVDVNEAVKVTQEYFATGPKPADTADTPTCVPRPRDEVRPMVGEP